MDLRADAEAMFRAGVDRVVPERLLSWALSYDGKVLKVDDGTTPRQYDLEQYERILLAAIGKASVPMAVHLVSLLKDRISEGVVVTKAPEGGAAAVDPSAKALLAGRSVRVMEAGHPVPDYRSLAAGKELDSLAHRASEWQKRGSRVLVIVLISGGGSSLVSCPAEGISPEDKSVVTRLLLACGASIHELNAVRKHLSAFKGGLFARRLFPAEGLALVLSDVMDDDLDVIASGPTVPDRSSWEEVAAIFQRYHLEEAMPESVMNRVRNGLAGKVPETPKPGDPAFETLVTMLIGTNYHAIIEAEKKAQELGYHTLVLGTQLSGEAREIARVFSGAAKDILRHGLPLAPPACIIAGGETTVTVRGRGRGGRNQEMALSFLEALQKFPVGLAEQRERILFLSAGTDGNDGPTDAAGAFADASVLRMAMERSLSPAQYLADNNSYAFFDTAGGLLRTGPTGTNVCDIQILLVR